MKLLALSFVIAPWAALQSERPAPPSEGRSAVAASSQAHAPAQTTVVFYEVSDLLDSMLTDFEPPQLGVETAPKLRACEPTKEADSLTPAEPRAQPTEAERRATAAKTLQGLITKYLTPKSERGGERIEFAQNGALIASLSAEQHRWLSGFLTAQRQFTGLVKVETRMFKLPRGRLAKLGVGTSASLATPADRDALLEQFGAAGSVEFLTAPSLTAYANQRANVSVLNQVAYVKDYTIEVVEPGAREIADPQVAVITEGLVLDLRATPLGDGVLGLDLQLQSSELLRPIRTLKLRLSTANALEVEIGLPEVTTVRIVSTVLVKDGASVLLSTPSQGSDEELALLVTATRVPANPTELEAR